MKVISRLLGDKSSIFGVYPSIAEPTIIYELASSSVKYANARLLTSSDVKTLANRIKIVFAAIFGVNPSLGALLVVRDLDLAILTPRSSKLPINSSTRSILINTSNRTLLLFQDDEKELKPSYVVHRTGHTMASSNMYFRLYQVLGALMPEPVCASSEYYVERGVAGQPWFQISHKLARWTEVKRNALETLGLFHDLISSSQTYKLDFSPSEVFDSLLHELSQDITADVFSKQQLFQLGQEFARIGNIKSHSQHGDFCINNLIFDSNQTYIIDFEDFNACPVILHDEFSLVLSFMMVETEGQPLDEQQIIHNLNKNLAFVLRDSTWLSVLNKAQLNSLLFLHFIQRLGVWSEDRVVFRAWLVEVAKVIVRQQDRICWDFS